jgi:hypothetical protein
MKDVVRIRALFNEIQLGHLSRNRHFEAFKDPDVRFARQLVFRAQSLARFLERHCKEDLFVELKPDRERRDTYLLNCVSKRWRFSWAAYLDRAEIDILAEQDPLRPFFRKHFQSARL